MTYVERTPELAPSTTLPDRFLRLEQVKGIVGLGRTMIYELIKQGAFPAPIKLGINASRWSEQALFLWLEEQKHRQTH